MLINLPLLVLNNEKYGKIDKSNSLDQCYIK